MTRKRVLVAFAWVVAALIARPALAEGLIRFRNVSFAGGVSVEVRVGVTLDTATLYGTQRISYNDYWEVDTTGTPAWWRREAAPGSNDGRFTAWERVDSSPSDASVNI